MIQLEKLEPADFKIFISWIPTQKELFQFAGPIFTFPLTEEQLTVYATDSQRCSYKVVSSEDKKMIGHCELNFERAKPRLSRILIGNSNLRNQGLGKLVVNAMLTKLFINDNYDKADLNVFDWNIGAIKCYHQIGFAINEGVVSEQKNNGETWKALNMSITKEGWIKKEIIK